MADIDDDPAARVTTEDWRAPSERAQVTIEDWRARAERALVTTDIAGVFSGIRAVIGPPADQLSELARCALEDLRNGQTPSPAALQALEYAIRLMRPVPLVRHGLIDPLEPDAAAIYPEWEAFQAAVTPYLSSVARVDRAKRPGYPAEQVGTGFLVGPTSLVTNVHVVDQLTLGTMRLETGQAVARFGKEYQVTPDPPPVPITGVSALHPDLDLAVLRVEPGTASFPTGAEPLPVRPVSVEVGMHVAAIGYAVEDARNPSFVPFVFGGKYSVKRVSLGEVSGRKRGVFFHDCTTLGGNSGSPILTLDGAKLVGVHYSGYYLARNEALSGTAVTEFLAGFASDRG